MTIAIINQITPDIVRETDDIKIIGLNLDGDFDIFYGSNGPFAITNSNPSELTAEVPSIPLGVHSVRLENASGSSNSFDIFVVESLSDGVEICPKVYSEEDYTKGTLGLLPKGLMWVFPKISNFYKLFAGISVELVRVQGRACDLIKESFPLLSDELLSAWEEDLGLPDKCSPNNSNDINSRRNQVLRKLTQRGGQSIAYYTQLAKSLGFKISISEGSSNFFQVGSSTVGESLDNTSGFSWFVTATEFELTDFKVGLNTVGQPLRQWFNLELECLFNEIKPAHTFVFFNYIDPSSLDVINENGADAGDFINENVV